MRGGGVAAIAAPSIGPAVVTVFGTDVPILALSLSMAALLLARFIAPPPLRRLTRAQNAALTMLLLIFVFLIVTGKMPLVGTGEPMGAGMAVVWGAGLGLSGLVVVEIMGERVRSMLRAAFGLKDDEPPKV